MKILSLPFSRSYLIGFWMLMLMPLVFCQAVLSQEKEHSFKITGDRFIDLAFMRISVSYDSLSADHLYICRYYRTGHLKDKTCYLVRGNKFSMTNMDNLIAKKDLILDGIQQIFSENEVLETESVYKNGLLQQMTDYYSNGNKHMMYSGDEKALNGAFKMWHPNGQLGFNGNYENNLKDGIFESFDASGNPERKGSYQKGKLIDGVAVVQDFVYDAPEVPVQYKGNDSLLNKILLKKSANLVDVVTMDSTVEDFLDLKFTIHKSGQVKKVEITNPAIPVEEEIIQTIFSKQFMDFQPATIEGAPVSSYFSKSFYLTNKGLQVTSDLLNKKRIDSKYDDVYTIVEDMPEFPEGEMGMRKFLAQTIRYPLEAAEKNIQGKVFVSFIIQKNGTVGDISLVRGVHPLLDKEAMRVVRQMPKWKPGHQAGEAVKVSYTIPINFVLE
jgi:TonB family protein